MMMFPQTCFVIWYLSGVCSLFSHCPFFLIVFLVLTYVMVGKKGNLCSRLHDDKTFPYCPQVTNWLYLQNIKGYRYALRRGVTPAISGCISTKLGDSKERFEQKGNIWQEKLTMHLTSASRNLSVCVCLFLACLDCVLLIYFKYIGYILVYFGGPKGLQLQFWCYLDKSFSYFATKLFDLCPTGLTALLYSLCRGQR